MKDKSMSAGMILMLLMLAGTPLLAGCGDFWEAPAGNGVPASISSIRIIPALMDLSFIVSPFSRVPET